MSVQINITGQKYGRLTALLFHHRHEIRSNAYWVFRCECNRFVVLSINDVRRGHTRSCGCLKGPKRALSERLWEKINKNSDRWWNGNQCWEWLGGTDGDGYGTFNIKTVNGKPVLRKPHRIAWELLRGPIPERKRVLHHCDNPGCCNPNHLFLGTSKINSEDMVRKGRQAKGEKNGMHKLTQDQVDWITVLANQAGWPTTLLAECNGVAKAAVNRVLSGRTWQR
jgi:HNH endonuclease